MSHGQDRRELTAIALQLLEPSARREIARSLAQSLGGEDLLIFIPDPEFDVLHPALGFSQTPLRSGGWRKFLGECMRSGYGEALLAVTDRGGLSKVVGFRAGDRFVLALVGGLVDQAAVLALLPIVPLLAASFVLERKASKAQHLADVAREAAERALVLADIGEALSSFPDRAAMLAGVAGLSVPRLADLCLVDLSEVRALPLLVAARCVASECSSRDEVLERVLHDPARLVWTSEIMRSGKAHAYPSLLPEQAEVFRTVGVRSLMIAPMSLRDGSLGTITFGLAHGDRIYGADDMRLAEDIGRRTALAVSNTSLVVAAEASARAREEFLSIASHELRTPLTSMKLNLQVLHREIRAGQLVPAEQLRKVETAMQQVERLERIAANVVDVIRIATEDLHLEREAFDLVAILRELAGRFREQAARAACEIQLFSPGPALGCWDWARMQQVFTNLLSNALRHGAGGVVDLAVEAGAEHVRVTLRDHGSGIRAEAIERIFERFEHKGDLKRAEGLGLGLYLARQIIEAHGGTIEASNSIDGGAIFTIDLPLGLGRSTPNRGNLSHPDSTG